MNRHKAGVESFQITITGQMKQHQNRHHFRESHCVRFVPLPVTIAEQHLIKTRLKNLAKVVNFTEKG